MEKIKGTVLKVTYFDKEKLFGIVNIDINYNDKSNSSYRNVFFSNKVTVLSTFDRLPLVDEEYEFTGEVVDSQYGKQFKASSFTRIPLKSYDGLVNYLSSDLFPRVGVATAKHIVDALGDDCIEQIQAHPYILDDIVRNKSIRDTIINGIRYDVQNRKCLIDLLGMGFSTQMASKLILQFGEGANEKIKNNPYCLMYEVVGFGFIRSDEVANKIGIKDDDPRRLKALIHYLLEKILQASGDTYIPLKDLIIKVMGIANKKGEIVNSDSTRAYIKELEQEHKLIVDADDLVYTVDTYNDEIRIADFIFSHLQNSKLDYKIKDIDKNLNYVMKENNIDYTPKQQDAIKKALSEPIVIITGGPGTGKSTIVKGIVNTFARLNGNYEVAEEEVFLCAPTGRAAKRLAELTLHKASTIHKLLGYTGEGNFTVNRSNPLEGKMIIVDEFSMVDVELARRLFEAIPKNMKVVLVGDADQLPSVNPGNCLMDLINCKEITTIYLDQIHRQESTSEIITLAHSIKDGAIPYDIYTNSKERRFFGIKDDEIIPLVIKSIDQAIKSGMDLIKDIQVLIPIYKGDLGIEAVNFALQEKYNPKGEQVTFNGKIYRERDKVLQLVNRSDKNVMNGDIGYIEQVVYEGDRFDHLTCVYDIGRVEYTFDELSDLTLAYAISIHKSQGSEFSFVIMPLSMKYFIMLKRKLIYTAVTRAKKYLFMIGNLEALRKGVVEIEEDRHTMLCKRIKDMYSYGVIEKEEDNNLEEITPFDFL